MVRFRVIKLYTEATPLTRIENEPSSASANGDILAAFTKESDVTEEEFAAAVGVDVRSVYRHLAGRPIKKQNGNNILH